MKGDMESARVSLLSALDAFREVLEGQGTPEVSSTPKHELLLSDLYAAVEADLRVKKRKDLTNVQIRWSKHMQPFFGAQAKASEIQYENVFRYTEMRATKGASPATINRELSLLKRMYKLAFITGRIKYQPPHIEMLPANNAREGFVKDWEYEALARETAKIGMWLRAMFEVAFTYGWRKSELLSLRVRQLDFTERTISLQGSQTKNRKARVVIMTDKVLQLLSGCVAGKSPDDFVFTRPLIGPGCLFRYLPNSRFWWTQITVGGKRIRESTKTPNKRLAKKILKLRLRELRANPPKHSKIWKFQKEWGLVRKRAGCDGLLFHDLRRTAVRNMIRAGIPEKVAMSISGHLTRSVFDRYHIINEQDLSDAAVKMQAASLKRARK